MVAVGHTILVIAYHVLVRGHDDEDLGDSYFDQHDRAAGQRRLVRRLEALGYAVQFESRVA